MNQFKKDLEGCIFGVEAWDSITTIAKRMIALGYTKSTPQPSKGIEAVLKDNIIEGLIRDSFSNFQHGVLNDVQRKEMLDQCIMFCKEAIESFLTQALKKQEEAHEQKIIDAIIDELVEIIKLQKISKPKRIKVDELYLEQRINQLRQLKLKM